VGRTPAAAVFLLTLAGCASSGSGGSSNASLQVVPVISDPTGATVQADGQEITTPGEILVPKGAKYLEIHVSKDGYEPATVILTPDTQHFRDCFAAATAPDNPAPSSHFASDNGLYTLGAHLLATVAACTADAARVGLQPTLVFVKLQPLPPIPTPPPPPN
jgi:hypothetical protein